jgi:large subunit ribosomal protein L4e
MAAAARPLVSVRQAEGKAQIALPHVFLAPIRPDIIQAVFVNMNKNKRQAYAVKHGAGMGHSAVCWGTGRAVARIPRVNGGGTSRAGQAAFGNMCRKGRMFAPTKTWRKWHRKINTNQKRYAVVSALAASALPALVMARGHKVENVEEVPLVVGNEVEGIKKTKQAVALLKSVGAFDDVQKATDSYKLRCGTGKLRGRRHVHRRGPLVVYNNDDGVTKAFRNIPGVETCHVDRLNLLQLAPGGHVGRFIVWSKNAFERLDAVYGSVKAESHVKIGYHLPRNKIANSDITSIINSDGVQSVLNAPKSATPRARRKKNPLKNLGVKVRLNPYALSLRRSEILAQERRKQGKQNAVEKARQANQQKRDKIHEPQQRLNYKKIADNYVKPPPPEEEKKEQPKGKTV